MTRLRTSAYPQPTDLIAAMHAEADAIAALYLPPWTLTIVEHEECAQALRGAGVPAVSFSDPTWQSLLPIDGAVLLVGLCQRHAGDVLVLGVDDCFGVDVPPPYRWPSEYLMRRAEIAGRVLEPEELRELWGVATDSAVKINYVEPTNHTAMRSSTGPVVRIQHD